MVTINGYTAERMKEIEDSSLVGAAVTGDNLILTKFNGTTIDAGNVRGPAGPSGGGDVDAKIAAALALADPPGVPKPYTAASIPTGHGLCDAQTEYSSGTYPTLAGLYGTGLDCINGASVVGTFRLPNLRGRTLFGRDATIAAFDTLHETGGTKDAVVVSHGHDASSDQASHGHGGSVNAGGADHVHGTNNAGEHSHGVDADSWASDRIVITYAGSAITAGAGGQTVTYSHLDPAGTHNHGNTGGASAWSHGHGLSIEVVDPAISTTVNNSGVTGTDANLPPYRVVNWIMRLV